MNHSEFYNQIDQWIQNASEESRRRFVLDIIHRFEISNIEVRDEFNEQEQSWLSETLNNLLSENIPLYSEPFQKLCDNTSNNTIRAIEFSPENTNFLSAINNWIQYRNTDQTEYLLRIAVNITDCLDHYLNGDWESETMLAEIEHQRRVLAGESPAPLSRYNWWELCRTSMDAT